MLLSSWLMCLGLYNRPYHKCQTSWKKQLKIHLEGEMRERLTEMLKYNNDVCTTKVGRTGLLKHRIFLTDEMPIKQKPYHLSPPKQKVLKELLDEMLENNVVVVIVPRKTGNPRFCVDYRKPNAKTHTDACPIPTIQEILESLAGATVFSALDLNSGYWQVEMDQDSRAKTVLPFGLQKCPCHLPKAHGYGLRRTQGMHVLCVLR